jgi:hypothetical protein
MNVVLHGVVRNYSVDEARLLFVVQRSRKFGEIFVRNFLDQSADRQFHRHIRLSRNNRQTLRIMRLLRLHQLTDAKSVRRTEIIKHHLLSPFFARILASYAIRSASQANFTGGVAPGSTELNILTDSPLPAAFFRTLPSTPVTI